MATFATTSYANQGRSIGGCGQRPRCGSLFSGLSRGPRFIESTIQVARNDEQFSLYYRVYNPSAICSSESPPLVVVHGGP
eukprot:scaffold933_cov190-Alexandrium_tamarense.AAC.16